MERRADKGTIRTARAGLLASSTVLSARESALGSLTLDHFAASVGRPVTACMRTLVYLAV